MNAQSRSQARQFARAFGDIEWIDDPFICLFDFPAERMAIDHTIWPREPQENFSWPTLDIDDLRV